MGAALVLGLPAESFASLADFHGAPGRLERIPNPAGLTVLVDYAHTPDALENVLGAAREFTAGKLYVVFGCGGDRDHTKRPRMEADGATRPSALRVDGGMVGNDWLMQFLSDMLALPVERPVVSQTTALGAAYLAGLGAGVFSSLEELSEKWQPDTHFQPQMPEPLRDSLYQGWREAVSRTLSKGT